MPNVEEIWERIHSWLEQNAPDILERLRHGATAEQIQELEEKLEVDLPEDFKESYLIHNGVSDAQWFFCNQYFHSIDDIILDWTTTNAAMEENKLGGNVTGMESEDRIQLKKWDSKWIPFGNNGCGKAVCVDLAPSEAGTSGQVFLWMQDSGHEWQAASFTEFLQSFADDLEAGRYKVGEDGKCLEWGE